MKTEPSILRDTGRFTAERTKTGSVRIASKERGAKPKSRTIPAALYAKFKDMNDSSFNGTCIIDLGIGVHF